MSIAALVVNGLYNRHVVFGLRSGDADPPVYTSNPAAGSVGATYLQITATATDITEPITLYAVALANGATQPSAAQVIAGTDSTNAAAPAGQDSGNSGIPITLSIAGLSATTAYDVFVVVEDGFANATTVTKVDITTAAASTNGTEVVNAVVGGIVSSVVRSV